MKEKTSMISEIMEPRYIVIMDFSTGELIKIRLTDEQLSASEEYEDFGDFLSTLEEEYDFKLKDCLYMTCHTLSERNYNLIPLISSPLW